MNKNIGNMYGTAQRPSYGTNKAKTEGNEALRTVSLEPVKKLDDLRHMQSPVSTTGTPKKGYGVQGTNATGLPNADYLIISMQLNQPGKKGNADKTSTTLQQGYAGINEPSTTQKQPLMLYVGIPGKDGKGKQQAILLDYNPANGVLNLYVPVNALPSSSISGKGYQATASTPQESYVKRG